MTRIKRVVRRSMVTSILMFLLIGLVLFTAGCKRKTQVPDSVPDIEQNSITADGLPVDNLELPLPKLQQLGQIEFVPHSGPDVADIRVLLLRDGVEQLNVVAYRDLIVTDASTGSELIRLAVCQAMEEMTHGLFLKSRYSYLHQSAETTPAIPILFQYPRSKDRVIKQLRGSVTAIAAEKTATYTIPDVRKFINDPSESHQWSVKNVEGHLLPSAFEGASNSLAITFSDDVLVTRAVSLDQNQKSSRDVWSYVEVLPGGRTRILISPNGTVLPEKVNLKFEMNSGLSSQRMQFDLKALTIPAIEEGKIVPATKFPFVLNESQTTPKNMKLQAYTEWSRLPLEFTLDESERSYPLEVYVEVFGENVINTIAVGNLNIDSAITRKEELVPVDSNFGVFHEMRNGLHFYDPVEFDVRSPVEGTLVPFRFEVPTDRTKMMDHFSGELTLVTATSHEFLFIDNILKSLNKTLKHPVLKEKGIELKPTFFGDGLNITVSRKHAFEISEITAIDASGGTSKTIYSGRQQFDGKTVFSFHGQNQLPSGFPVRIRINHGLKKIRVPFEFKNIPVPAQKR